MDTEDKIKNFNPNGVGNVSNNIFGLPFTTQEAQTIIIPIPWDVTVSSQDGTANGPEAVFNASFQIDLYDPFAQDAWKKGIAMEDISFNLIEKNGKYRKKAKKYIEFMEEGGNVEKDEEMMQIRESINKESAWLTNHIKQKALEYFKQNKMVAILGGDHSTPLGLIEALAEQKNHFGILHIDAHADLRKDYMQFSHSHASIMFNALKNPQVNRLVQVGVRDYCEEEKYLIENSDRRIITYFDRQIKHKMFEGHTWKEICFEIVDTLPEKVYVSFDIDGLDPKLCPNTGTPVPGGLDYEQAMYLIEQLVRSGRTIIGFDLVEVAPGQGEIDAVTACRVLYRLANMMAKSNNRI